MYETAGVFHVETEQQGDNASLFLTGDLNAGACDVLAAAGTEVVDRGCRDLVIFLWQLEFADTAGMRCLADVADRARRRDIKVRVVGASGQVERAIASNGQVRRALHLARGPTGSEPSTSREVDD